MVTSTWTHPLTLLGTQINFNMCPCNQVQCVCGFPAAHQEPVPARRGHGRPAGSKNHVHVDDEGTRVTAVEKRAADRWDTWADKARGKSELAMAARAAADAAAAARHESPAKAREARTKPASAAAADKVAAAAWAKADAVQEKYLEAKANKPKVSRSRAKRAPLPPPAAAFDQPPPLALPPGQLPLPPWPPRSPPPPPPHQFVPNFPPPPPQFVPNWLPSPPESPGMSYQDPFNGWQLTPKQLALFAEY